MTREDHIFHDGMAEALGVSEETLQGLSLSALAELAFSKGYLIRVGADDGIAPGLTMRGPKSDQAVAAA